MSDLPHLVVLGPGDSNIVHLSCTSPVLPWSLLCRFSFCCILGNVLVHSNTALILEGYLASSFASTDQTASEIATTKRSVFVPNLSAQV